MCSWRIADYWIVRKTKLHVPMLYQNEGIYRYKGGVNWRAALTLLIVVPINLPGLINAIDKTVDIGNYSYFYKASWLTSFFIAFFLYSVFSLIAPPRETLVGKTVESLDEDPGYPGITSSKSNDRHGWEKDISPTTPSPKEQQFNLNRA